MFGVLEAGGGTPRLRVAMARLISKYGTEASRTEELLRTSLARARTCVGPEPASEASALANLRDNACSVRDVRSALRRAGRRHAQSRHCPTCRHRLSVEPDPRFTERSREFLRVTVTFRDRVLGFGAQSDHPHATAARE